MRPGVHNRLLMRPVLSQFLLRPHPIATPFSRGDMSGFRSKFVFPDLSRVNWYPGHMAKGFREAVKRLNKCDCVIEVHDARVSTITTIFTRHNFYNCYST